jgi:hypothetical protein
VSLIRTDPTTNHERDEDVDESDEGGETNRLILGDDDEEVKGDGHVAG